MRKGDEHFKIKNTKDLIKLRETYALWTMRILSLVKIVFDGWTSRVESWWIAGDEIYCKVVVDTIFVGTSEREDEFSFPISWMFLTEKQLRKIAKELNG